MLQKMKTLLPISIITWEKSKGLISFLVIVFALVIYFSFFNESSGPLKAQPSIYSSASVLKQDTQKVKLSLKEKLKPLEVESNKKKSDINISKYYNEVIRSVTYNTMGNYKLPDEISNKLKLEIDSVFIRQMNAIVNSYKHYKINILSSDTSGVIIFQKM
jgi:hypothetical protein